jgi:hypothetical protein
MGYNPENLEKGNKSEQKPKPKPDIRKPLGGAAIKGAGGKKP